MASSSGSSSSGSGTTSTRSFRDYFTSFGNMLNNFGARVKDFSERRPKIVGALTTGAVLYAAVIGLSFFIPSCSEKRPESHNSSQESESTELPEIPISTPTFPRAKNKEYLFNGDIDGWNVKYRETSIGNVMFLQKGDLKYTLLDVQGQTLLDWNSEELADISGDRLEGVVMQQGSNKFVVKPGEMGSSNIYDDANARYHQMRSQIRSILRDNYRNKTSDLERGLRVSGRLVDPAVPVDPSLLED